MALSLEATKEQWSTRQNVTLLSETPIIIQFSIRGDVNGDRIVDIYDAILLAGAYNSKPGDPNWRINVDINGDNIVDIYDAIILANHYNQHYP